MKLIALVGVVTAAMTAASCDTRAHVVGQLGLLEDGGDYGDGPAHDALSGDGGTAPDGAAVQPANDASVGVTATALVVSPREAVTRVARVLWEAPPDSALVAMADSGALATDADMRKMALDMLGDARSRVGVAHFYRWWLELDRIATREKDPQLFPQYSSALATTMASETETFGVDVTLTGDGRFASLMQASYSFLNESLASLYGVAGVTGPDLRKVDLDPTQRAGLFTHPFFLTLNSDSSWTSPTRRGVFIANKMLCAKVPPPPPDVSVVFPASDPKPPLTNRQRLEQELLAPACTQCHQSFDPLGYAYETFDSIGRVRLTDSGLPIDASGRVVTAGGAESAFDGAVELAAILAKLPDAHRCMGSQWLEYILGRSLGTDDGPSVTGIHDLFVAGNGNLRALIAAAASSPSFLGPSGGPPCKPGLDQTCNDSLAVSSIRGTCTPAGKCVCNPGVAQNPTSGRCQ